MIMLLKLHVHTPILLYRGTTLAQQMALSQFQIMKWSSLLVNSEFPMCLFIEFHDVKVDFDSVLKDYLKKKG